MKTEVNPVLSTVRGTGEAVLYVEFHRKQEDNCEKENLTQGGMEKKVFLYLKVLDSNHRQASVCHKESLKFCEHQLEKLNLQFSETLLVPAPHVVLFIP